MTIGLIGRKRGMTRIFSEDGVSTPVTVIEVEPNRISQLKSVDTDGYNAIQVTVGERKASRVTNLRRVILLRRRQLLVVRSVSSVWIHMMS